MREADPNPVGVSLPLTPRVPTLEASAASLDAVNGAQTEVLKLHEMNDILQQKAPFPSKSAMLNTVVGQVEVGDKENRMLASEVERIKVRIEKMATSAEYM